MIKASYDTRHNAVVIEFSGSVTRAQAEKSLIDVEKALPKHGKGFTVITDLSGLEKMGLDVKDAVTRSMDLLNAHGVERVIRVIPDSSKDIGFNILSAFHYSKGVKILTLESWREIWEKF
jgi:hypothetical protein